MLETNAISCLHLESNDSIWTLNLPHQQLSCHDHEFLVIDQADDAVVTCLPNHKLKIKIPTNNNLASSSSSSHFTTSDHVPYEPQFTSPAFTSHLNPSNPNQFSSFTSLLDDDALFSAEYNASTSDRGRLSNDAFVTPRHSIHLNDSPWFDLNTSSSHPNDNVQYQQNDIEEQRPPRPQRRKRGTRCGTGSHYL